jgi:hypothetical protein
MDIFILLVLMVIILWGAWGLLKFILSNFAAVFWTSIFFLVLIGFYLTETVQ